MPRPRDPFRQIEPWLRQSHSPLFLVENGGTLRWFNAGCELLTGWAADEVVGQVCRYSTVSDATTLEALTGALCPPPDLWNAPRAGQPTEGREAAVYIPHRSGEAAPRRIRFIPLEAETPSTDGAPAALLGIILPWREPELVSTAVEDWHAELAAVRSRLRQRHAPGQLVCRSHATRRLLGQIDIARPLDCHLLLVGEPGAGKEHIARTIHFSGPAKSQWFVPLECGKTPADELRRVLTRLLERHETPSSAGRSPMPGTVYLEDADRLPRDLQEQIIVSLSLPPNQRPRLRFMGATALALDKLVTDERMRADFHDLLSPLAIDIPPLRDRRDDVMPLAQHFLEDLNRGRESQLAGFTKAASDQLVEYRWPGNLDELARVVREACDSTTGTWVDVDQLPFRFRTGLGAQRTPPPREPFGPIDLDDVLARCEKELIGRALAESRNNVSRAAELLGVNRPRLYRRMEQLGFLSNEGTPPGTKPATETDAAGQP